MRDNIVVAPALSYGASGEHSGFAGTLSIGNAATELVLIELVRSAAGTWSRVILISTHGGNDIPVRRAVEQLRSEGRDVRAWFPSWPGDAHAGHTETSIMLSVAPERVDRAAAAVGALDPLEEIMEAMRAGGIAAVSPNGVLGDPTRAVRITVATSSRRRPTNSFNSLPRGRGLHDERAGERDLRWRTWDRRPRLLDAWQREATPS